MSDVKDLTFGVGNDREAVDEFKYGYQDLADETNLPLEDVLASLAVSYDCFLTDALGPMAEMARMQVNEVLIAILVGLGADKAQFTLVEADPAPAVSQGRGGARGDLTVEAAPDEDGAD